MCIYCGTVTHVVDWCSGHEYQFFMTHTVDVLLQEPAYARVIAEVCDVESPVEWAADDLRTVFSEWQQLNHVHLHLNRRLKARALQRVTTTNNIAEYHGSQDVFQAKTIHTSADEACFWGLTPRWRMYCVLDVNDDRRVDVRSCEKQGKLIRWGEWIVDVCMQPSNLCLATLTAAGANLCHCLVTVFVASCRLIQPEYYFPCV